MKPRNVMRSSVRLGLFRSFRFLSFCSTLQLLDLVFSGRLPVCLLRRIPSSCCSQIWVSAALVSLECWTSRNGPPQLLFHFLSSCFVSLDGALWLVRLPSHSPTIGQWLRHVWLRQPDFPFKVAKPIITFASFPAYFKKFSLLKLPKVALHQIKCKLKLFKLHYWWQTRFQRPFLPPKSSQESRFESSP